MSIKVWELLPRAVSGEEKVTPSLGEESISIFETVKSDEPSVVDQIIVREKLAHVGAAMHACLTPRERAIVILRARGMVLEDVGRVPGIDLTRERVRQIEDAAIKKVRGYLQACGQLD